MAKRQQSRCPQCQRFVSPKDLTAYGRCENCETHPGHDRHTTIHRGGGRGERGWRELRKPLIEKPEGGQG